MHEYQSNPPPNVKQTKHSKGALDHSIAALFKLEQQVLEKAVAFKRIDQIAEELEMDESEVKEVLRDAMLALRAYNQTLTAHLRDIEHARLETAGAAIWDKVLAGNLSAVRTFLEISKRKAALWGLDAPEKIAVTDSEGRDRPSGLLVQFIAPVTKS